MIMTFSTHRTVSWELFPHKGIGPIRLGQPQQELRDLLGPPETTRTDEDNTMLRWGEYVKVWHLEDGIVNDVEVMEPSTVSYLGVDLLNRPVDDVRRDLDAVGVPTELDTDDTETLNGPGFRMWINENDDNELLVMSVCVSQ